MLRNFFFIKYILRLSVYKYYVGVVGIRYIRVCACHNYPFYKYFAVFIVAFCIIGKKEFCRLYVLWFFNCGFIKKMFDDNLELKKKKTRNRVMWCMISFVI